MLGAADVDGGRALRIGLGAVHVRPGGGVQHEVGRERERRRGKGDVPVGMAQGEHLLACERFLERVAELAARARDQDAAAVSRGERIGDRWLHRSTTRGSSQAISCSSGSAGSYSSVTW